MSNYCKKRPIPHHSSVEGLHKYFKPLNEIQNKTISSSSVTQSTPINDIQTADSSRLCLSPINSSSIIDEVSRLTMNDNDTNSTSSTKPIQSPVSTMSTESAQSSASVQSDICIQSSNTPPSDQNNRKIFLFQIIILSSFDILSF
jgi:hypothetical protein